VLDGADALGAGRAEAEDLVIAIDEAATNLIRYGYRDRPGPLRVELDLEGSTVVMRLVDNAPVFDPTAEPEPDLDLDLGRRPFGGMGIHLMRTSVDRVVHAGHGELGNDLTFFKRLTPKERSVRG
jgi:serine/threonine-protein kinase RsbW